jgi:hypothetical protein
MCVCVCERERERERESALANAGVVCCRQRRVMETCAIKKSHHSRGLGFRKCNPKPINPALHFWGKFRRSQHMVQEAGSIPIITTFMDNTEICP